MRLKAIPKTKKRIGLFGLLVFVVCFLGTSSSYFSFESAYAVPETSNSSQSATQNGQETNGIQADAEQNDANAVQGYDTGATLSSNSKKSSDDGCKKGLGGLAWIGCLVTEKVADAVDWIYSKIEGIFNGALQINPAWMQGDSAIRQVWEYIRILTNAVFIGFFLVVIYSQLTGYGISNYGIKKVLPKVVLVAILINLSFLICALAIDISNVIGNGIQGFFASIEEAVLNSTEVSVNDGATMAMTFKALALGTPLVIGGGAIAIEYGMIWMIIPMMLGGLVSVVSGLITITLRQAVVALLVMISPLAFVAYMLPNTEEWFKKWKKLFTQMLVFYPAFGLLFGASNLAAFAIRSTAVANQDAFWLVLSLGVQVFPLLYSVKLMKMSGTFLGDINARMQRFAEPMLTKNREWADSHRQVSSYNALAYGRTPFNALRRKVGERRALREAYLEKLKGVNKSTETIYVQQKFASGYDGTKSQDAKGYFKPNKYTRVAKDASTLQLESETATADTAHAISNYGDYFVSKRVRDKIKAAEKVGDLDAVERIKGSDTESRRASRSAKAFLEYSRAMMTKENDEEADYGFMIQSFLSTRADYDPNDTSGKFSEYKHYILSSAGGLGETGEARVLGKILNRAAAIENAQRHDYQIIAAKHNHDKRNFRNMFVGYYNDDDGYATDKDGNKLAGEKRPGYLLQHHPEQLVKWDKIDENVGENGLKYFDWYDGNQFVTRIYENDSSAFKELFSTYDAPINDPINNLYGILAGMSPGKKGTPLEHIGLSKFRTTIGRALQAARFKEKNPLYGAMAAEMLKKGYIKNYAQMYLAYLDNLNKATKPGDFNKMDSFSIDMIRDMMDPENWPDIFREDMIRDRKNVNGELISGYKIDADGNLLRDSKGKPIKVANDKATYDELMAYIKEKFLNPAASNITWMMEKDSPDIEEQRKHGTVGSWKALSEMFKNKWGEGKVYGVDPYAQKGDMRKIRHDLESRLYDGTEVYASNAAFHDDVNAMYVRSTGNADRLATNIMQYCDDLIRKYPEQSGSIEAIKNQFNDYIVTSSRSGKYPSTSDLQNKIHDLINIFMITP